MNIKYIMFIHTDIHLQTHAVFCQSCFCFCSFLMIYLIHLFTSLCNLSTWLLWHGPRLLRPLYLGLPVLRVPDALQHGGGAGLLRRMHIRGLLLLLLYRRHGWWLQLPLWHGLWHHGCLLRVLRLPGNLYGVLWHLLPYIGRRAGVDHVVVIGPWKKI